MGPKKRSLWMALFALAALAVLAAAVWFLYRPAPQYLQGEIEAAESDVSAKIAGRVASLAAEEGQKVRRGQVLAVLESPEVQAKLRQAEAAREAADARKEKADGGAREEEIRQAYHLWQRAQDGASLAEKTFRRIDRLFAEGVVPAQRRDETESQWRAAVAQAEAAQAAYDLAKAGARREDRAAADALVRQASGMVSEVGAFLEETQIRATLDGEVREVIARRGEMIAPGYPIIRLVNLKDIWATFNIREDRLAAVRMGDRLTVTVPALGNRPVVLRVTFIAPLGDFATWRATSASGDFDVKTFEVKARPVEAIPGLRPGMSVLLKWDR
ncbi:MAG: efflux RND transporter periplasmic adaptor subunit [Deltaproteobacteria bacterium]|nr:efflux RND transporter periplasmic adaptor subunit [Deltaproteobacteria bacterium]